MPEVVVDQPVVGSESVVPGDQHVQAPGWLAGLPADLRDNEAFKSYRTVGDFAKAHLDTAAKAKEYEGKILVGKYNVEEGTVVAEKMSVQSIPAFFIFKNGVVVASWVGAMSKEEVAKKIEQVLK